MIPIHSKFPFLPSHRAIPDLARTYDQLLKSGFSSTSGTRHLAIDLEEHPDRYVVTADLPGIDRDSLEVSMQNGALMIRVPGSESEESTPNRYLIKERKNVPAIRVLPLPHADMPGEVAAELREGTLTVSVPKAKMNGARRVQVK
jgi:HSP20 family protein